MDMLEKYLFITPCGEDKNKESFEKPVPLRDMYTGCVYSNRIGLFKCITDEVYIASLLGQGVVRDTYVGYGYIAPPPSSFGRYMKEDREFCSSRRKTFEERYPGRLDMVEKVFFLGCSHYDEPIMGMFLNMPIIGSS